MGSDIIWGCPNLTRTGEIRKGLYEEEELITQPEEKPKGGNQIYFWDDVSDWSVINLMMQLRSISDSIANDKNYKTIDPIPIWIYVNSYGGDLLAGFNAMDEIINISKKVPVYTVVDGKSASASTFINLAGTQRFMKKNSFMLIHELSSMTMGRFSDQKDHMKNMDMFMDKIKGIYEEKTNLNREELDEMLTHDIWLDAEKSLEYGLIDRII